MDAKTPWDQVLDTLNEKAALPRFILLWGPPSTGKSRWAERLGRIERVTLNRGMDVQDLLGGYQLTKGQTKFHYGPAVRAMTEDRGLPLVIDEIEEAGPEVITTLHAILDEPPAVTLPNGERIVAQEGFRVIATTNQSPEVLSEALGTRFRLVLYCGTPSKAAIEDLPKSYQEVLRTHYGHLAAQKKAEAPWSRTISVRGMIALREMAASSGEDLSFLAGLVFGKAGVDVAQSIMVHEK